MPHPRFILGAISAALVGPTAFAQSWDDKVTLTVAAKPASEAVAELAKASGMPMSVSGLAKNDIVFLHLKNVPVQVAADKIAEATGSMWIEQDGQFILTRTAAEERKQWDADAKGRKTDIEAALAAMTKAADAPPAAPQGGGGATFNLNMLSSRATLQALSMIPAEQLAAMEPDQRLVYATRANGMQRTLPAAMQTLAKKVVDENLAMNEALLERMRAAAPANTQGRGGGNQALAGMQRNVDRLRNARIGKTFLILQNQGGSVIIARLDVVDVQGQTLATGNSVLQIDATANGGSGQVAGGGTPLKFSDRAKALAALFRQNRGSEIAQMAGQSFPVLSGLIEQISVTFDLSGEEEKPETIEDTVRALMSRPDLNDPLEYFTTEMLRLAADEDQASLVACIPDSALQPSAQLILGNASKERVWNSFNNLNMVMTKADGLIVAMPKSQSRSRYERMNRVAVAELIESGKKGYASLDDLGKYAMSTTRGAFTGPIDLRLVSIAHPEVGNGLRRNTSNQEALAIFTMLNPTRRANMIRDKVTHRIADIGARDETSWLVFNSNDGPRWQDPNQRRNNNRGRGGGQNEAAIITTVGTQFAQFGGQGGGVYQERTEQLPTGLPTNAIVSLTSNSDSMLRASENLDQTSRTAMLTPEGLGAQRAQRDSPAFADARGTMPEYRAFTMSEQASYVITITLAENITMTRVLQEVRIDPNAKPMAYADLPENLRRRADESYNRTYEAMKNMRVGRGGGGGRGGQTPPPQ